MTSQTRTQTSLEVAKNVLEDICSERVQASAAAIVRAVAHYVEGNPQDGIDTVTWLASMPGANEVIPEETLKTLRSMLESGVVGHMVQKAYDDRLCGCLSFFSKLKP